MASRKKMQKGICRLCKHESDLTFEHIPPKSAFNKTTAYKVVDFIELFGNAASNNKIKGQKFQGGIGEYSLCSQCNNFLGKNYVNSYKNIAQIAKAILENYDEPAFEFEVKKISPLRLLKQVISMFISINPPSYTDYHPELLKFVMDSDERFLSDRYKIYMYLNEEGMNRHIRSMYNAKYGFLSEITFPPLGFVLSTDELRPLDLLFDITAFKNSSVEYEGKVRFSLNVLPTNLPAAGMYC